MTLDSYRLITTRTGNGNYSTKLTYNGKDVEFNPSIGKLIDELGANNIRILANNPSINRLEVIISGEDLK